MAGRLDRADLESDLLLIALKYQGERGLADLRRDLQAVDPTAFVFDGTENDDGQCVAYGSIDDYVKDLRMFDNLGFVDVDASTPANASVALTDRGDRMATILLGELKPAELRALEGAEIAPTAEVEA